MLSTSSLLASLAFALLAAGLSGAVAARLGQSVILGYIVAGVIVGPYTPGVVADEGSVEALAEIGVVLLLFVTGTEISLRDLARSGRVALGGATIQITVMVLLGYAAGLAIGWDAEASLALGAVVSISSTAVLSKVLSDRSELESSHARLALAWAAVQDLATVVLVVILTGIAQDEGNLARGMAIDVGKAGLFLLLLLPIGGQVLPKMFSQIRAIGQREVFVLSATAMALITAWAAEQFGLSPALGAFLAGVVLVESDLRHELIEGLESLRDIFVGLFFVSIGMLVDPGFVLDHALLLLLVVVLIVPVKGLLTGALALAFGAPPSRGILAAGSLAQAGEFSFLLATTAATLGIVGDTQFSALVVGSTLSVILAPSALWASTHVARRVEKVAHREISSSGANATPVPYSGHVVICGHGRVGRVVGEALREQRVTTVVIDQDLREVLALRSAGVVAYLGSADNEGLLRRAGIGRAALLIAAVPDRSTVRRLVRFARGQNPRIRIVARTHEVTERDHLEELGVDYALVGELELAVGITRYALEACAAVPVESEDFLDRVRHAHEELDHRV